IEVVQQERAALAGQAVVPAARRIIVVRTGVGDHVFGRVMRQERVGVVAVKGKLQYAHPRETKIGQQLSNVIGDRAQVLGDEWQIPQLLTQFSEEIRSRAFNPLTLL